MTGILQQAFDRASSLPPELQDELGAFFMAEINSELRWKRLFDGSQNMLARMGQEALEEYRAGRTTETGWDKL
ncbi:MAG TPA: hypothetical protein VGM92_06510 [Candidatus Kapabacteria bacterium]|jgi:hypothetical protein